MKKDEMIQAINIELKDMTKAELEVIAERIFQWHQVGQYQKVKEQSEVNQMSEEIEVSKLTVDEHYQTLTIELKNGKKYLVELTPTE